MGTVVETSIGNEFISSFNISINRFYTKITFIERDLNVSPITAVRYLTMLEEAGFLKKVKKGRTNYYIHPTVGFGKLLDDLSLGPDIQPVEIDKVTLQCPGRPILPVAPLEFPWGSTKPCS